MSLSKTSKTANLGLHVYTGGVVFQQTLIVVFLALTMKFKALLRRNISERGTRQEAVVMIRVLRFSLLLITVRTADPTVHVCNTDALIPVSNSIPNRRIFVQSRDFCQQLYQPPRIFRLRFRRCTYVLRAASYEHCKQTQIFQTLFSLLQRRISIHRLQIFEMLTLRFQWHPGKKLNDDGKGYSRSQSEDRVLQTYNYGPRIMPQYEAPPYPPPGR